MLPFHLTILRPTVALAGCPVKVVGERMRDFWILRCQTRLRARDLLPTEVFDHMIVLREVSSLAGDTMTTPCECWVESWVRSPASLERWLSSFGSSAGGVVRPPHPVFMRGRNALANVRPNYRLVPKNDVTARRDSPAYL